MTAQHTPGPWRVLRPSSGIDHNWHVTDETDTFVAHVFGFSHSVDEQSRVNAILISAAPDLLEALQSLVDMDVSYQRGPRVEEAVNKARYAIAKATGGAA